MFAPNTSVISGTHRAQDLIPAFLDAIRNTDECAAMTVAPFGPTPSYVMDEGDDSEWWDSDDAQWLLDELVDILNDYAPEGYYFGAHDGSDFGFWTIEE